MDIFQILSRGTQYDKKKFSRDVELFGATKAAATLAVEESTEALPIPDFFAPATLKAEAA
jgi:hypothetical protein